MMLSTRVIFGSAFGLYLLCWSNPSLAFTITRQNDPKILRDFLFGDTSGLSNFKFSLNGSSLAYGVFEDDPFNIDSGVVLSTGDVKDLSLPNTIDGDLDPLPPHENDLSTDLGDPGESGDSIDLEIWFDSDGTKDTFYFQYVFGSEEFVEFGGSDFNDSFSLKLNGQNLAKLSDGETKVETNNLVPDPIAGHHPDYVDNPVGTGPASDQTKLDGYTVPLLFSGPITSDKENQLIINVQDVGDGIFDSVVFLKAGTFGTVEPPPIIPGDNGGSDPGDGGGSDPGDGSDSGEDPVSVPEPSGLLGLGAALLVGCVVKRILG